MLGLRGSFQAVDLLTESAVLCSSRSTSIDTGWSPVVTERSAAGAESPWLDRLPRAMKNIMSPMPTGQASRARVGSRASIEPP